MGDWIIYYEPVKAGAQGYFAIAKIERIVPDPIASGLYLALIEPGTYLKFEQTVQFRRSGEVVERGLLNAAGKISGRAQSAVRPISLDDFNRIIDIGISDDDILLPRNDEVRAPASSLLRDELTPFVFDEPRTRVETLTSRAVRDRVFRKIVLDAYDARCAITGIKLINGGGRAEVEAAHIKGVAFGGPDSVNNGLALSGTAHWMFDRGLISLTDDLNVLVSRHVNDTDSVWKLVQPSRKASAPTVPSLRPHSRFLDWHRSNCFKH